MSKKILLISTSEIIQNSVLQENVDVKILAKTLAIVQETGLKQILGSAIYTELLTQVENNIISGSTIQPFYSSLIDVSKPYLIAKTTADFIIINNYKFTDKGILKLNDNTATAISEGDLQALKDYYDNLIASYKKDLLDYLSEANAIDNDNDIQITSEATGWYLGIPYDICEVPIESNITEVDEYIEPNVNGFTYTYMSTLNNVILISIDDIVGQSVIQDNVDVKLLSKTISIVQDVHLKAVLTDKIYYGLLDSVYQNIISGTTQAAIFKDLLTFVKPYLINKSVAEFLIPNQYKVTSKGILKLNDTSANSISEGDLQAVKDYYDNISTTYKISLIEFLNKYGLIACSDNDITSDATGWYLGSNYNNGGFNLETQESFNNDTFTTNVNFTNDTLTLTDNLGGTLSTTINTFNSITTGSISATTYLNLPQAQEKNIYTDDGTLEENRLVDLADKTLSFSSSTQPNTLMINGGNVGISKSPSQGTLDVQGTINIPTTSNSSTGVLRQNGEPLLHRYNSNTSLGFNSLNFTTTGSNNIGIGANVLTGITTSSSNIAIGNNILNSTGTGNNNIGIGGNNMIAFTGTNGFNVALGINSLRYFTNQSNNISPLGAQLSNVAIGSFAMEGSSATNTPQSQVTGAQNVAVGTEALRANSTGSANSAFGYWALRFNTTGFENMAVGTTSLRENTTGFQNVGIGREAFRTNTTGSTNVAIGYRSGFGIIGNRNTIIGTQAGEKAGGTGDTNGNVYIGYRAGFGNQFNNKLYIANDTGIPLIGGDFSSGYVGINTSPDTLTNALTVAGGSNPLRLVGLTSASDPLILTVDTSGVVHTTSVSAVTAGVSSITVGNGLSQNSTTGNVTISLTASTGGGAYLPLSGGTVTGDTLFSANLSGNSIYGAGLLDVNEPYNVYDNGYFRGIYSNPVSNLYTIGHQSKGVGETIWGITIEGTGTTGQILIGNSTGDVNFGITNGEYYFPRLTDFTTTRMVTVDSNGNLGATTLPASINPNYTYIPYNNAGLFADSPIRYDNTTNRLYTEFLSQQEGFNLQYDDGFYKFGQFSNGYNVSFDVTNDETILRNPFNNIYFTGYKITLQDLNYDLSTTQIELDTNEPFVRLGNYTDPTNNSQKNGIYITPTIQNVWIGTFDDTNGDKNNGLFVNPTDILLGSNTGSSNKIIINNTPTENVEIAGNLLVDSTSTTLQQFQGQFASGTKMVVSDSSGTLSLEDKPIGISNGTVYYFNASVFQTGTTRTISPTPTTAVQTGLTISVANGLTGLIGNFLTPLGNPNANTIPPGIWSFYLHLNKSDSNASFRVYCEVFKRTSGGTEISLFNTSPEVINTVTPNIDMYVTDAFYGGITANTSDRILVKVYAQNTGNQTHSITLFTEGTTYYSYATFPFVNLNILTCDTLPNCSTIQALLPKSGGTITGDIAVTGRANINTVSATTYQNLPIVDSQNNGILRASDFTAFNNKLDKSGGTITGNLQVNGNTILGDATTDNITISASTITLGAGTGILNIDSNTFVVDGLNNRIGISTQTPNAKLTIQTDNIGTTQSDSNGLYLINSSAATVSLNQNSPAIVLQGQGWKTSATASSRQSNWRMQNTPAQDSSEIEGRLTFEHAVGGGSYSAGAPYFWQDRFGNYGINATTGSFTTINGLASLSIAKANPANSTNHLAISGNFGLTSGGPGVAINNSVGFTPASGAEAFTAYLWNGTITQPAGSGAITRGIHLNPTVAAATTSDFRALESSNGRFIITDSISAARTGTTAPALTINQTFNTTAFTHTMLQLQVTNLGQGTDSRFIDAKIGGTTRLVVTTGGRLSTSSAIPGLDDSINTSNYYLANSRFIYTSSARPVIEGISTAGSAGNSLTLGGTVNTTAAAGEGYLVNVTGNLNPTSSSGNLTALGVTSTFNQTGGANGTSRGLYINPTLTSAVDFRAIEVARGSIVLPYRATGGTSTVATTDYMVDATAATTITLPTAVGMTGKNYIIKNTSTGTTTVNTTSSQTIDGATTYSLNAQWKYVHVVSNGSNWLIIANN